MGKTGLASRTARFNCCRFAREPIDHCHFHNIAISDISTLQDAADAGDYEVVLWDSGSGTGMMYFWNYDYPDTTPADKKIHDLYRNPKFKQAMSLALDRATIQKTVYYNTGILTTGTMSPKAFEFNFNAEAQAFFQKARRHLRPPTIPIRPRLCSLKSATPVSDIRIRA